MPRARKKPSDPRRLQTTDTGPDTPAQRAGAVYEKPKGGRPGEIHRRRVHPMELLHKTGAISTEQMVKASAVLDLYEETLLSPGGMSEYVDKQPDWGAISLNNCAANFAYASAIAAIPSGPVMTVFKRIILERVPLSRLPGCSSDGSMRRLQRNRLRIALDLVRA